jgi:maltose alpha-D-glucosyltransferase/alpha-amylase
MDAAVRPSPAVVTSGPTSETRDDALWYKDAVVYQLHLKAFHDSNDDGIGDFRGLTQKLQYVHDLGVNTIWLLPFYPSPLRDDGYDVADYRNIHAQYGTRSDFRTFMREARRLDLRVITEMVINHTSDQHAWFQAARRAPKGSSKRNYYVWSDDPTRYAGTRIILTDTETSNWAWDDVAKAYYWHRFFSHQPDLNFDNPNVLKAVFRVMRFWLDMGVDGFRLDAIPYLCEREGTSNENLPETHAVIRELRALIDTHYGGGRVLLAEANQWPEDVREYFGAGDECHMAYHFPLMPRIYMAIAQEDRHPVVEIMHQTPDIPDTCQWAIFLRNHDELTLEMVTSRERDYMYKMYAVDARARVNLGIRRRLAPLMDNDTDRIKLMNSLLLSMPGSPIIYYGDEIGMGDNVFLGDRNGVRTPMQWSPDRNGGFSHADPQRLYLPPVMDSIYGYGAVNVEAQSRDPSSLLNWMRRILAVRNESHAFGRGQLKFLQPGNRKVLVYLRELEGEAILCVANLARTAQPVELDLSRFALRVPVELLGRTPFPPIGKLPYLLTLPAHAFYWFRLATDADVPQWHEERLPRDDLPVLVLFDGWSSFFRDRVVPWRIGLAERTRARLEQDVLPRYLESRRWYAAKGGPVERATLVDYAEGEDGRERWMFALLDVASGGAADAYFVPLVLAWDDEEVRASAVAPAAIAKVRQQADVGVLADAYADETFCRWLVAAIGRGATLATQHGEIRFVPTRRFGQIAGDEFAALPVDRPHEQGQNTVVTVGDRLILKGYRRLRAGINPEFEVARFLTEVAGFSHCVPVAGAVEYTGADSVATTLALLQSFVANQGDGWSFTLDYLARYFESLRTGPDPPEDVHAAYLALIQTLGMRIGELHLALSQRTGDLAFDPVRASERDAAGWRDRARQDAAGVLDLVAQRQDELPEETRPAARALLEQRRKIEERFDAFAGIRTPMELTRFHGDLHLGQVLLANNDFVIIDFGGEPSRPLTDRRRKDSPLRDVAGMLRSFNYARWTAVRNAAQRPEHAAAQESRGAAWEADARATFLRAYSRAVEASPLSESLDVRAPVLQLFELEKALYELHYEITMRPAWVGVPLQGILDLVRSV